MKQILFIVPTNYKKVGGLRMIIDQYISFFEHDNYDVAIFDMPYHLGAIAYHKCSRELEKNISKGYSIVVSFALNQSYLSMKMLHRRQHITYVAYLIDSMKLNMVSVMKNNRDYSAIFSHWLRKIVYTIKEQAVLASGYKVVYVSPVDCQYVKGTYSCEKDSISLITNGVVIPEYNFGLDDFLNTNVKLGMLTDFSKESYNNNVKPFLEDFFPLIRKVYPQITLTIAGGGANKRMRNHMSKIEGVTYLGYVDTVDEFYSNVNIVVTAVRKECGIINRVLEAWTYKRLVVGFSKNFKAFTDAKDGMHYLSADVPQDFVEKIRNISLANYNRIINNAYELVKTNYCWETRYKQLLCLLNEGEKNEKREETN